MEDLKPKHLVDLINKGATFEYLKNQTFKQLGQGPEYKIYLDENYPSPKEAVEKKAYEIKLHPQSKKVPEQCKEKLLGKLILNKKL